MAMFQQYTGGIQGVQGIAEAGANVGRFNQQGLQEFGKSLAEGIQAYHQNQALDEQATQEGHAVAQQLAFYHQVAAMSPENSALLPALDEQVKTMQKLPTMSLTQKLGALNGAKSVLSQFGQNYQLNQVMQQQRALNALPEAEASAEGENVRTISANIDKIPYNWSLSPQQNIDQNLIPELQRMGSQKGVKLLADSENISRYLAGAKTKATSAVGKDGKPLDPSITAPAVEQLDKYLQYKQSTQEGDVNSDTVTDYSKEAEGYKAATESLGGYLQKPELSKESYDRYKSDVNAVLGFDMSSTKEDRIKQANEQISDADKLIAATQKSIDDGSALSKSTSQKAKDWLTRKGSDLDTWIGSKFTKNAATYVDKKITPEVAKEFVNQSFTAGGAWKNIGYGLAGYLRLLNSNTPLGASSYFWDDSEIGKAMFGRTLTREESKNIDDALRAYDVNKTQKIEQENQNPEELISALKDKKQYLADSIKKISAEKTGEAPVQNVAPNAGMPTVETGNLTVGSYQDRKPLTLDQRKSQVQDWYKKEYGYIPSSFNQIWEQQHPESKLKVITDEATGLQFYSDGKGEFKIVPKQGLSPSEQDAALKLQGRGYNNQEVARGSGVRLNGVITGEDVQKFRQEMIHAGSALNQINALFAIMEKDPNGRSFHFTSKAEAEKYIAYLKSMVRGQLFPSGRVAEWEQKVLDNIVPNPTGILTLDESTVAGLNVLRRQIIDNIADNAADRGLTVTYNTAETRKNISALASQAKQANRVNNQ